MKKHKILIQYRGGIKAAPKYTPFYFKVPKLNVSIKPFTYTQLIAKRSERDQELQACIDTLSDKMLKEITGAMRSALIYGIGFTSFNTKPPMPLEPLPEQKPNRFKALGFSPILQVKNIPAHAVIAQA